MLASAHLLLLVLSAPLPPSAKLAEGPGGSATRAADSVTLRGPAAVLLGIRGAVRLQISASGSGGPLCLGTLDRHWPIAQPAERVKFWLVVAGMRPNMGLVAPRGATWTISSLTSIQARLPAPRRRFSEAVLPPALPAQWQPKGTLDAMPVMVGDEQFLSLQVDGIHATLPPSVQCRRGLRQPIPATAGNDTTLRKPVHVTIQGPPQIATFPQLFPFRPRAIGAFTPTICCLWAGEAWARITIQADGIAKSVPIKVHCAASYPAFGALAPPDASSETVAKLARLPLSVLAAPARALASLPPLKTGPEIIAYGDPQALRALSDRSDLRWLWITSAQQAASAPQGRLIVPISPSPPPASQPPHPSPSCTKAAASLSGAPAALSAMLCPPPAFAPASSGPASAAAEFWRALAQAYDLSALRTGLPQPLAKLPIVAAFAPTAPPPHPACLARAVAELVWSGAGIVLAPTQWLVDDAGKLTDLGRAFLNLELELSSAQPDLPPPETRFSSQTANTPITFWPFVRGEEGTVVICNTTGRRQEIAVEFRPPIARLHLLRFSPAGAVREMAMPYRFPELAVKLGRQLLLLSLDPGETAIANLWLRPCFSGWLRSVEPRPSAEER